MMQKAVIYMLLTASVCLYSASTALATEKATVIAESLAVHSKMSSESAVIKTLNKGDVVVVEIDVSSAEGTWCGITMEGETGFVFCEGLERAEIIKPIWEQRESPEKVTPPTTTPPKAKPPKTKPTEPLPDNGGRIHIKYFSVLPPTGKQWRMTGKGSTKTGESSINFQRDTGNKHHEVKARVVSLPAVNMLDEKALMRWVKQRETTKFEYKDTLENRLWMGVLKSGIRTPGTHEEDITSETFLGRECVRFTRKGFSGTVDLSSHLYPPERREEIRAMERGNNYSFVSYYCLTPSPNAVVKLHYFQRTPVGTEPVDLEAEVEQMLKSLRFDTEENMQE